MKKRIVQCLFCISALLLGGCHEYQQSLTNVNDTQTHISQIDQQQSQIAPPVLVRPGYYVSTTPTSLDVPAKWLGRHVSLQANQLPLNILMKQLLRHTGVGVSYDTSVAQQDLVSLDYQGTVEGALERIAAMMHYSYSISKDDINWSAFETKTFAISFMPGTSNYLVGQSQNEQQNMAKNNETNNSNRLNDQQFSSMSGQLSVWRDVARTLNSMKSKQGKVILSESTSNVTVSDHPANVKAMADYIKRLNVELSKQVLVKVQVLEVNLNNDSNYGIDWGAVAHTLNTTFRFTGGLGSGTNLVASSIINNSATSTRGGIQIGNSTNKTLIGALSEQGRVRVVTKPQVVTMNNQIASIRITQDTGYIQSVNMSRADNYFTTSITPGSVTDGFTLYVLPRIQNGKVYMQISSRIASLVALQKESTEPTSVESGSQKVKGDQQYNAIEVPTIASKEFNQRSVVPDRSTLIIAGYKRLRDQTKSAKYFEMAPLGGRGSQSATIETLVLITPVILKDDV